MSYSFSIKADSKEAALADATQKFDAMINQQPVHGRDREAALANFRGHLALLPEPSPEEEVTGYMNGSISIENFGGTTTPERVMHAGSGCSVGVSRRAVTIVG